MNCKEARSHIEDALDETLSGGVKHRLDLHLQHCTECRAYFEAEKAEFARWCTAINHGARRNHSLPEDFADRLVAAVTAPRPLPFLLRLPRWALVAASAAIAFIGFALASVVVGKYVGGAHVERTDDALAGGGETHPASSADPAQDTAASGSHIVASGQSQPVAKSDTVETTYAVINAFTANDQESPDNKETQEGNEETMNALKSRTMSIAAAAILPLASSAGSATYYQVAGTNDATCIVSNDGLAFEEEITTTPKLAFPGITLDDIPVGASFFAKFWGSWSPWQSIDQAVTAVGFCEQRCDSDNDGHYDKIALQVCVYEGMIKGVVIVLTNGDGGVCVQRYGRVGVSNSSVYTTAQFTLAADGTMSHTSNVTTGDDTNYRLQGLSIHGMSPVNTASRLAFRGVTLEEIKDSQFMAGFQFGTWMTAATVSNTAAFVSTWHDGNHELKKVVMQFRASTGATAVIELTDGVDGVYVQQVLGVNDDSSANTQVFAINAETGAVTLAAGKSWGAEKYGIHDFVIKCPPCLKKTPNKIKVWSSGDSGNPLTLDDVKYGTFGSRFFGAWVTDKEEYRKPNAATGTIASRTEDDSGSVTNMVVWFEIGEGRKRIKVMFENGADGIYATGIEAKYTDGNKDIAGSLVETYEGGGYALCDLRVTVPMEFILDQDMTWGELTNGESLAPDEHVLIKVTDANAVLTVDENVEVATIEFVDGTGATLQINSGYTLTAEDISGIGNILNNGTLVKKGSGMAFWPFNNASTGTTTVSAGTLKVASQTGSGTSHTVRVKDGATFDLNGVWATALAVVLEEGATFTNSGNSDAEWGSAINIRSLTLEGNATVTATHTFGLRTTGHGANTLNLGTYTLEVKASSGKDFILDNTTITGTGTIAVKSGRLASYSLSHGDDYMIEVASGASLLGGGGGITCGGFENHGTVTETVIVKGTLTPGSSLPNLTLANGAAIKASVTTAQIVSTTFAASGTIAIDASEITAEELRLAERIPVLTVPMSSDTSTATWTVSNTPMTGARARWINDDGGTTKTLYLCKSVGLIILVK